MTTTARKSPKIEKKSLFGGSVRRWVIGGERTVEISRNRVLRAYVIDRNNGEYLEQTPDRAEAVRWFKAEVRAEIRAYRRD